jgi:hypothetical protein
MQAHVTCKWRGRIGACASPLQLAQVTFNNNNNNNNNNKTVYMAVFDPAKENGVWRIRTRHEFMKQCTEPDII